MFGFSLPKVLVLALIVAAVWYGYKWMGRQNKLRDEERGGDDAIGRDSEDLILCALCGTYGPKDLERCPEGRDDCPMVGG